MDNAPYRRRFRKRGWIVVPLYVLRDLKRMVMSRVRLSMFRQRERVIHLVAGTRQPEASHRRILAVITHVVGSEDLADETRRRRRADTLSQTIDGLLCSLSHHTVTVVLNTYKDRNVIGLLPLRQRASCEVIQHLAGDPMLIEYDVQEIFIARRGSFDWFVFLEDDILISDACFLEKLEEFNRKSVEPRALLLPHRFEWNEGAKYYVDRDYRCHGAGDMDGNEGEDVINPLTTISFGSDVLGRQLSFAEFTNPHAACYCLNRSQLERWEGTGRRWYKREDLIGQLEGAATFALYEAFELYKPHPKNKWYLEVQHLSRKYSDRARSREEA